MHYIQKSILDELRLVSSDHYAMLNKHDIESGHFRYHLGQLITDGYVQQLERGIYSLTTKGQQYVDELSSHRIHPEKMPKVITYTLLTYDDKILLQKKPKQPYKDLFNMIGGKVHLGESTEGAAVREVLEKTGETIVSPKLRGVFEVRVNEADTLFTHVIAYVYEAALENVPDSVVSFTRTKLNDSSELSPDLLALLGKIESNETCVVDSISVDYKS
jgi:ADP-ribose pyrophosphatase YjhB (NUDIX family)